MSDRSGPDEFDTYQENGLRIARRVSQWGPACQNLMDHPKVAPYLIELLGPEVRIDHDYCIFMKNAAKKGGLHGGSANSSTHWYKYRDGVMRNGLTVFVYALSPARKGDGGFCCIPGSHKSNFLKDIPQEVRQFERPAHYVVQPEVDAGDLLIFTEATVHGTQPWTSDQERRSFLFKYSPGHSAWWNDFYNPDEYSGLSEQQKRIMEPAFVGGGRPDTFANGVSG
jgi:ectoine hydroxylase-related dioxygenase (phytanoyl-CoA dioxygenase family)